MILPLLPKDLFSFILFPVLPSYLWCFFFVLWVLPAQAYLHRSHFHLLFEFLQFCFADFFCWNNCLITCEVWARLSFTCCKVGTGLFISGGCYCSFPVPSLGQFFHCSFKRLWKSCFCFYYSKRCITWNLSLWPFKMYDSGALSTFRLWHTIPTNCLQNSLIFPNWNCPY